jgi:hypothetical protein
MTMEEEKTGDNVPTTTGELPKKKKSQMSASEEAAAPYPDMDLCQNIHQLTVKCVMGSGSLSDLQTNSFEKVGKELENPSLCRHMQKTLKVEGAGFMAEAELSALDAKHVKHLEALEAKVEEAKESAGDMEVMEARVEIAQFAAKSLSKDQALEAYKKLLDLPKVSSGKKIDCLMESSRVASFYGDTEKSDEFIEGVSRFSICL